jgi:hypothetical protein
MQMHLIRCRCIKLSTGLQPLPNNKACARALAVRIRFSETLKISLAKDMNPAEGFNNMANALVYYWMQGCMSAANMALLEGDNEYVDLTLMDEKKLLPKIHEFCTKNPDKKPISLIDQMIEDADKIETKWKGGTIPWAADDD